MTKQEIRESVWKLLKAEGVARFPGARGRIPNFKGAESCAPTVGELSVWRNAEVIKANPDSPQRALRHLALKQGKTVYMAVPRLRDEACFIELDPERLRDGLYAASSIKGAFDLGRQVRIENMRPVDLVVTGSVAVRRDGARVGKGGGYSDLEYAIARQAGLLGASTPILTTVHELQIVDYDYEISPHDIPVDFIVTPDESIASETSFARPKGIYWEYLGTDKIDAIPVLQKLRSTL